MAGTFEDNFECLGDELYATTSVGQLIYALRYLTVYLLSFCIDYFFYFANNKKKESSSKQNLLIDPTKSFREETKPDFISSGFLC